MKIEISENNKRFCYRDIEDGECFAVGTAYYIKTWGDELSNSAVNVKTGEIVFFIGNEFVEPIDAVFNMRTRLGG